MRDGARAPGELFSRESRHREDLLTEFEAAWHTAEAPDIAAFVRRTLPPWLPRRGETITELVRVDQELRIKRHERLPVEEYLSRLEGYRPEREERLELVLSEFNLRSRFEVPPGLAEYVRRFPDLANELQRRLAGWNEAASRDGTFAAPLSANEVVLHVVTGPHRGTAIRLNPGRPLVVGRGEGADVRLEQDRHLSRFHVRLNVEGGRVTFADLNSRNGAFLDGRIVAEGALTPGGVLRCGESEIVLAGSADATCDLSCGAARDAGVPGYRIEGVVARGSLGPMFRAVRSKTGEAFALKRIERPVRPERMAPFLDELMTLRELNSRVLLLPTDVGLADGRPYLATPWQAGGTFEEMAPGLGAGSACRVAERVLKALAAAHRRGLVHGSITPSKVLLNETAGGVRVKVTGFGLRRHFGGEESPGPLEDLRGVARMLRSAFSGEEGLAVESRALLERVAEEESDAEAFARELAALRAASGRH